MRKLILLAHTSLDGFVAGINGELDGFEPGEENLEFVCKLTREADAALFGRLSYQMIDAWWPSAKDRPNATKGEIEYSNWYNRATKIVVSSTLSQNNLTNTIVIKDDVINEIKTVKEQPGKDILIFGSPSVTQLLMEHSLIDSYWIFINPATFGRGIPLFTNTETKIKFRLTATHQFANGELALNYIPIK